MTLAQRMTEVELTEAAKAENKTLIIESIMFVVRLLNSWMKVVQVGYDKKVKVSQLIYLIWVYCFGINIATQSQLWRFQWKKSS
jgi:hypothetical protein